MWIVWKKLLTIETEETTQLDLRCLTQNSLRDSQCFSSKTEASGQKRALGPKLTF